MNFARRKIDTGPLQPKNLAGAHTGAGQDNGEITNLGVTFPSSMDGRTDVVSQRREGLFASRLWSNGILGRI
jgi:hypothetical protein